MKENSVTFRRIRGRIVPIRNKTISKEKSKAAGFVAAGAGLSFAAGKAEHAVDKILKKENARAGRFASLYTMNYRKAFQQRERQLAFGFMTKHFTAADRSEKYGKLLKKSFARQKVILKASMAARPTVLGIGASLVGLGVFNWRKKSHGDNPQAFAEAAAAGSAVGGYAYGGGVVGLKKTLKKLGPKAISILSKGRL